MKKVLTIAGSSTSGGAGIQADLKAFAMAGVYGMTALTTIVVQNPADWSHTAHPTDISLLCRQLDTILSGIGVDAVKTGMLGSVELINVVAEHLDKHKPRFIVVDPVIACKGADSVMNADVANELRDQMVKRAYIITPNLLEAGILTGMTLNSVEDMKVAAKKLHQMGATHVLIKGGARLVGKTLSQSSMCEHSPSMIQTKEQSELRRQERVVANKPCIDIFYDGQDFLTLQNPLIEPTYNHGAGCTYAATIAAELAKGKTPHESVTHANKIVHKGIKNGFRLNEFVGCLNIL